MQSPPIGILTHNRPVYLDAVLRSIAATDLPADATLTVYDDGSTDPLAKKYLYTDEVFRLPHRWPEEEEWWGESGLDILESNPIVRGLASRTHVVRLGKQPRGVLRASCAAVRDLFARHPESPGVFLLQDDAVYTRDWYTRCVQQLGCVYQKEKKQGIVSGYIGPSQGHVYPQETGLTDRCGAICYLITREFFETCSKWFHRKQQVRRLFDTKICQLADAHGFEVQVVLPCVCQHFGIDSTVRPETRFKRSRLSKNVAGPLCIIPTDEVLQGQKDHE